jgi:uncharacterized protein DUF6602
MTDAHLSKTRGTEFLQRAFGSEQSCLVAKLRSSDRIVHDGDRGEVNEQYFIEVIRNYLPNRYTVHNATILDSDGQVSDSIDVVVHDRQYTPTLLDSESHRYIPAEAVYAVFECKPTIDKGYLEYAGAKAESVRRLKRTSVAIPHAGGSYPAKPHFDIIAGILAIDVDWKDGFSTSFESCHAALAGPTRLNCGLAVDGHAFDTFKEGGGYTYCKSENALIFFLFRLLNQLQSLGTVPAVDWNAYAAQLSK